ncbi:Trehalose-phosphate phosphatase [Streptomyces sp. YIM 130001]|uniref:trehalose-phosphatase n=1 Tax=Streptomyces sp. YIM 130001 TaxID=2259644 RepID=UPI000E653543|nr:trehalose-phosphatase [Streptomyces sp. YIM 130001]RII13721.1 Trehalose-phosphate phosphatase [Streptomyces sp. YIM 130001]
MGTESHRAALPEPTTPAGRDALRAVREEPERAVVALDFDGTLAEIVADPTRARAHPAVLAALTALAPKVASVVVVTGRPAAVAVEYGGFGQVPGLEHLVVLGHYGAERWDAVNRTVQAPPPHPGVAATLAELPSVIADSGLRDESWIEEKGRAVAVHTRRATDPAAAFDALRAPLDALAARHELIVEPGRYVLELRPPGMDKGVALTDHLRRYDARSVLYAGDDLGDLPAFAAVERIRTDGTGRTGLLVCSGSTEVTELAARADLVVPGPAGVASLLTALASQLP